jgi:Zinc finger, C3HC4 type (RING finger)
LFDIDENSYVPYPASFSHAEPLALPLSLNDPFEHPDVSFENLDYPHGTNISAYHGPEPFAPELCCSVCGNLGPSLAELEPCTHLLCSACLTSALNIVGEKDMECAVCKTGVANFHLRNTAPKGSSLPSAGAPRGCLMPGAFDGSNKENLVNDFHFFDMQGSSTPNRSERNLPLREGELPVLRIDNVPWVFDVVPFCGLDLLIVVSCYCRISLLPQSSLG